MATFQHCLLCCRPICKDCLSASGVCLSPACQEMQARLEKVYVLLDRISDAKLRAELRQWIISMSRRVVRK